jgi:RNA recognition motif-containing protein
VSKLFVGGLAFQAEDQDLFDAFSRFGRVVEAKVILDRETGRSRGFGFVTFSRPEDAESAGQAMDGADLLGRSIRVSPAENKAPPPRRPSGPPSGRDVSRPPLRPRIEDQPPVETVKRGSDGSRRRLPPPEHAFVQGSGQEESSDGGFPETTDDLRDSRARDDGGRALPARPPQRR